MQRVLSWRCCAAMPHHSACSRCGCACLANTSRAAKPPPGRGVVNALWWEGTVETQGPDSLFWVFSATSRAGCFLVCLTAHRHQLTLAAFVRRLTRTQPPVLCFLLSASLDGNNFHLLDGVFWALPHLLSPVLLPYIYIYIASVFLKMWFPELHSPPPTT